MPPVFTRQFAERLDAKCALRVREAVPGIELRAGEVLLAPGDFHLRLRRSGDRVVTTLDQGTPENYCRPAVDVLFRSVVEIYGGGTLGLVLTGMGADGARSERRHRRRRRAVYVQDEASSVVWGMPGAVAAAGAAARVLPLTEVAPALMARISVGRPSPSVRHDPLEVIHDAGPRRLRVRQRPRPARVGDRAGARQGVPGGVAAAAARPGGGAARRRRLRGAAAVGPRPGRREIGGRGAHHERDLVVPRPCAVRGVPRRR